MANDSGETFDVINPATGKVIYQVEVADEKIKQETIASSRCGFATWSAMSAIQRSRLLLKAVVLLRERNDELAEIEVLDTGKLWQEASVVDVESGADAIEFFAGLAPGIEGNQQQVNGDFYYTRRDALGICAALVLGVTQYR
jgi:betaine-aldehyde dehydrogenase